MKEKYCKLVFVGLLISFLSPDVLAAGLPTLKTIVVDGTLSDWDPVLTNPVQVSFDNDGSSFGKDCIGSLDRDCEVKGGAGRDLLTFAWTYDTENIYFYIRRWGSSTTPINFFFVMDLDGDAYAQNTDVVYRVKWSGNNRTTEGSLFYYSPANNITGDSLVDAQGFADGYDMPGSLGALIVSYNIRNGGELGGERFEEMVTWSDLGVSAGTPILWHVASNNNNDLTGVVDNMGAPDGGIGTFAFGRVYITPSYQRDVGSPDSTTFMHTIENQGNQGAIFDLSGFSMLGLSLSYNIDTTADGNPDTLIAQDQNGDGDFSDSGDFLDPNYDNNAAGPNGLIDFYVTELGGTVDFWLTVDIPAGLGPIDDTVRLRVVQDAYASNFDQTEDLLSIGALTVFPDWSKSGMESGYVDYPHQVANNSGLDDQASLKVQSSNNWAISLWSDTDQDQLPDVMLAEDYEGDGVWDWVLGGVETNADGDPLTSILANGQSAWYVLRVHIPVATVGMLEVTQLHATSITDLSRSDFATDTTLVLPRVSITPEYEIAAGTHLLGIENSSVYFPFILTNSWTADDSFDLSANLVNYPATWNVVLWSDPNQNGVIDDGSIISGSVSLGPMGETFHFIVEVQIPAGLPAPPPTVFEHVDVLAQSLTTPGIEATSFGELEIHQMRTFIDSLYSQQERFFASCDTVYTEAIGLEVGFVDRYQLRYFDPTQVDLAALSVNADSSARSAREFQDADTLGIWTLELWDTTLADVDNPIDAITVEHENSGSFSAIQVIPDPILHGENLFISLILTNDNARAEFDQSLLEVRVLSPNLPTEVLLEDGTFVDASTGLNTNSALIPTLAPNESYLQAFTISNIDFPVVLDNYTVEFTWKNIKTDPISGAETCSAVIISDSSTSFYVDGECAADGDCDDSSICTTDTCNTGTYRCEYTPDLVVCDDGYECTIDSCNDADGSCSNTPDNIFCNDLDPCTLDQCDPVLGDPTTGCISTFQDADSDGQCDALDPCPNDPLDNCDICPDTDGDGICNLFDVCPNDPTDSCGACADDDNDGICNAVDSCPLDPTNSCLPCADQDSDGLCDTIDPCPADADNLCADCINQDDSDGDGLPHCIDPCPNDASNSCVPCNDQDGDGVCDDQDICPLDATDSCVGCADDDNDGICNANDQCPADPTNSCAPCSDQDNDGLCDDQDPCPLDAANLCNGCADQGDDDSDGIPNCIDSCPQDATNSCVPCNDQDGDGVCDDQDICPNDATDSCTGCADDDNDGICNANDQCPDDPTNSCLPCSDQDNDGLCDDQDPCPQDAANLCNGCADQADDDNDGIANCVDSCPQDATNSCVPCNDQDGDGATAARIRPMTTTMASQTASILVPKTRPTLACLATIKTAMASVTTKTSVPRTPPTVVWAAPMTIMMASVMPMTNVPTIRLTPVCPAPIKTTTACATTKTPVLKMRPTFVMPAKIKSTTTTTGF
jgi:hypothetical protein